MVVVRHTPLSLGGLGKKSEGKRDRRCEGGRKEGDAVVKVDLTRAMFALRSVHYGGGSCSSEGCRDRDRRC